MQYVLIIGAAIEAVEKLISLIQKARAAAAQTGELTPQDEAELDEKIAKLTAGPHWKIEP